MVPIQHLRDAFSYDPETGILRWKAPGKGNPHLVGVVAGSTHPKGYIKIQILGRCLLAHRVAWAIHFGNWPDGQIDHVNRVKTDNRIVNLRSCTNAQNTVNRVKLRKTASAFKGVRRETPGGNWCAVFSGRRLGTFHTEEAAAHAYDAAAFDRFGEFAVLNFPLGG